MELWHDMARLFEGHPKTYGEYVLTGKILPSGKVEGHGYCRAGEPGKDHWLKHLRGEKRLGIVPINGESNIKFGAIDIDVYDLKHQQVIKKIKDNQMPLVPIRSKSGGLHLYVFIIDWMPAGVARHKLQEMASFLGHGSSEIFPRQNKMTREEDRGNWINMPYFDTEKTECHAYNEEGTRINLKQFIKLAYAKQLTSDELVTMQYGVKKEILKNGPPCLNRLCMQGFPPGQRNIGLFNLGVYARKANPDEWEKLLRSYAEQFLNPQLTSVEVNSVVKSLSRDKKYSFQCNQEPLKGHCDRPVCRAKKYGIGIDGVGLPVLGTLTKLLTTPATWIFDVEGGKRMQCHTTQLMSQHKYRDELAEQCSLIFANIKQEVWNEYLRLLFENVNVVEVPKDATPDGQLEDLLWMFLRGKNTAKTQEDILNGKIWHFCGKSYFRLKTFMDFLERQKFKDFNRSEVAQRLRNIGAINKSFRAHGTTFSRYIVDTPPSLEAKEDIPEELKDGAPL